ncbi:hypothetical protein [Micromonospora cathayae]|uniref:Uncharacterized protein n=1 Tax=Micromonospora cathayae TaxID=3028804 RepID=A0ABY7ZHV3_9ACTN|nr:hypothetical protein [Micromonospora sp. HUAS 3]WDZ82565.1 hypothetical protein PVK37_19005 [Micromonospora sp. HUAS 3]
MTDTEHARPDDDRRTARRAAEAATAAARDLESFLRTLPETADPSHVAEYANLLSRDERARADRQAAVDRLGLTIGSIESG